MKSLAIAVVVLVGFPPVRAVGAGEAARVTIAAAGDISCPKSPDGRWACRDRATSRLVLDRPGIDRVLTLGDNQYEHGWLSQYLAYYDHTWGRFKGKTSPSPGNHDHGPGYYRYWGAAAGPRGLGYYAFDLGGWRLYALNSSLPLDEASEQYLWLRQDLEDNLRPCALAYWHHPRWSSGPHGNHPEMDAVWDLLHTSGAEVVLSGHDHLYERFAPLDERGDAVSEGMRQFVVGTGGRSHYGIRSVQQGSEVRNTTSYGVLRLNLRPDGYDWRFLRAGGGFVDAGSDACR
jgi:acid phosphatase type 7